MSDRKPCIAILEGTLNEGGINSPEFKEYSKRSNVNGGHMAVLCCKNIWSAKISGKAENQILSL